MTGGFPYLLSTDGSGPEITVTWNGPNNAIRDAELMLTATTLGNPPKTDAVTVQLKVP